MRVCLVVYFCLLLYVAFFSSCCQSKKNRILFLFFVGFILVLQMALRKPTLEYSDLSTYYLAFYRVRSQDLISALSSKKYEKGFLLFTWIIGRITSKSSIYFTIIYCIDYYCILRFIYKYSKNIYISVLLFFTLGFYGFSLTGVRQTLAASICLVTYDFIEGKKPIKFIITVLIAFSIHVSSIIVLPIYFLRKIDFNKRNMIRISIISSLGSFFLTAIFQIFNHLFEKTYGEEVISSLIGRIIFVLIYLIVYVIAIGISPKKTISYVNPNRANYEMNAQGWTITSILVYEIIFGIVLYSMQFFGIGISNRIALYFTQAIIFVLVPNLLDNLSASNRIILKICFPLFAAILFFVGIYRNNLYDFAYAFSF